MASAVGLLGSTSSATRVTDGSRRCSSSSRFDQSTAVAAGSYLAGLREFNKGYASLEPTSTEVGSSEFEDDSAEAARLLQQMEESQGRKFEEVFTDPNNKALAARTYPKRDAGWHSAATPT